MHEEHLRQVEAQLDYLAPFLAQLPPGEKLTRWQAVRLKDECLSDFKQRLIDKANLIQARFEKVWPGPRQGGDLTILCQKIGPEVFAQRLADL